MSRSIAVTVFKHSPVCYWSAKQMIPPQTHPLGWVTVTLSSSSNREIFQRNQPVNGSFKVGSVYYSVFVRKYFNTLASPPHPFYRIPQISSYKSAENANKFSRFVCVWLCFSGCYQLTSVCPCVCATSWQEEFVLLSGSLKSSSSLDSKPGLMTRPIHWHLSALWAARRTAQPKTRADRQHHRVNTSSEG